MQFSHPIDGLTAQQRRMRTPYAVVAQRAPIRGQPLEHIELEWLDGALAVPRVVGEVETLQLRLDEVGD